MPVESVGKYNLAYSLHHFITLIDDNIFTIYHRMGVAVCTPSKILSAFGMCIVHMCMSICRMLRTPKICWFSYELIIN